VTANDARLTAGLREITQDSRNTDFVRLPFQRALDRGEISPDADVSMLVECLLSALINRLVVTGSPIDRPFMDRLARVIKTAAGTGPEVAVSGVASTPA
jgi:hypothetical protein